MKEERIISRGLALFIGAVGLYIVWSVWYSVITRHLYDSVSHIFFLIVFPIPATCVAIYFFHTVIVLWQGLSSRGICKLSIVLSIMFAILLLSISKLIIPDIIAKPFWSMVSFMFIIILAGIFCLCIKRYIFRWFSVQEEIDFAAHQRAVKLYFGFLAFFLWTTVTRTVDFLPKDTNYKNTPDNMWLTGLIMFGSIFLTIWFYKVAIKIYLKKPIS
jgi:hypothetical protein